MPRRRQTSAKREGRETGPLRSDRLPLSTLLASAAPPRGRALDEKPQPFGWGFSLAAIIWLFSRLTTTGAFIAELRDRATKNRDLRYCRNATPQ